jgi:SNF family Na+-dependent transporter
MQYHEGNIPVSFANTLKNASLSALASVAFYAVAGIAFLILLPLAGYPPHIGLTGIMSLITAYALFTKRRWATWLVVILFFVATTISLYTLYFIILSNWLTSLGLIVYAVLTWYFTYYSLLKRIP